LTWRVWVGSNNFSLSLLSSPLLASYDATIRGEETSMNGDGQGRDRIEDLLAFRRRRDIAQTALKKLNINWCPGQQNNQCLDI
jgi:hypothetical protein